MVKILAYLSLFSFLAINTYFLLIADDNIEQKNVSHTLSYLEQNYQDCLFECFYALQETRPFAIIQVDRLVHLYNNAWTEPDKIVAMLNKVEKQSLISKLTSYIEEKDEVDRSILLQKITNWCRVKKLFSVIDMDYGYKKSDLINATSKLGPTSYIIDNLSAQTAQADMNINSMSALEENEAYYKTINHIAGLKIDTQFDLYSQIFKYLATNKE